MISLLAIGTIGVGVSAVDTTEPSVADILILLAWAAPAIAYGMYRGVLCNPDRCGIACAALGALCGSLAWRMIATWDWCACISNDPISFTLFLFFCIHVGLLIRGAPATLSIVTWINNHILKKHTDASR